MCQALVAVVVPDLHGCGVVVEKRATRGDVSSVRKQEAKVVLYESGPCVLPNPNDETRGGADCHGAEETSDTNNLHTNTIETAVSSEFDTCCLSSFEVLPRKEGTATRSPTPRTQVLIHGAARSSAASGKRATPARTEPVVKNGAVRDQTRGAGREGEGPTAVTHGQTSQLKPLLGQLIPPTFERRLFSFHWPGRQMPKRKAASSM